MYQRKRGLLRVAAIGQVIIMAGAGCKSSTPKQETGTNDVSISQALVGKDGSLTVTGTTPRVVNGYAVLAANAAVGAPSVQVVNLNTFTATNTRPALAVGDVVLIIQMAGATINGSETVTANISQYGNVTNLNSAGRYEFAGVTAIDLGTNTITLGCGLKHAYTTTGKTQVVRVPQYTNLTIESGASITADAWNGSVGGVVAVHAMNTITVAGTVDVSGKGFRGGEAHRGGSSDATVDVATYSSADQLTGGGMKGEGIAGWPADFANPYGRGAPANAGGGGNWHNAGGGGGANVSATGTWTGQGVMSSAAAWSQDPQYANGTNFRSSVGGGRGGYSYSAENEDATTVAPGDTSWGGAYRRERGGLGGHPLTSSAGGAEARLFMGGGGGAGDGNDNDPVRAGAGGPGGGLAFLIAGTVTGAGTVNADGAKGGDSSSNTGGTNSDGAGGGGAGGTILIHAGILSNVQLTARGGLGGNQAVTLTGSNDFETEGPGGGGGGGFIAYSGGTPGSANVDGRAGGTTNSEALTEFPSNGASAGNLGVVAADETGLMYCTDHAAPNAIIITKPSNPSNSTTATFTFGSVEANSAVDAGDSAAAFVCRLDNAATYTACPPTYIVPGLGEGTHTMRVRVVDLSGNDAGVGSEDIYTWRVDLAAPIPRFLTGPGGSTSGGTSNSTTASFTLEATERDAGVEVITFRCRLDSNSAAFVDCGGTGTATPTFSGLTEGTHTLDVRARDDAGNETAADGTVRWTWTVHALDAGSDAEDNDAGDAGPVDAPGVDAVFTDGADADEDIDTSGTVVLDASPDQARDTFVAADRAPDTARDTSISFGDAARDGVDAEVGVIWQDASSDATDALASDARLSSDGVVDASLPRDTAVAPSPDAYVAPADTAKPVGQPDAPAEVTADGYKLMGGGFCSMNPSGDGAPGLATLFLVAAFGLLIVRRRRS
jgi:hypothetical protein